MHTVGIDIAGANSPNGLCILEWAGDYATVQRLVVGKLTVPVMTSEVQNLGPRQDVPAGIDAPFGFPMAFSNAVRAMAAGNPPPSGGNPLVRRTEAYVKATLGKTALSPVTSLITNTVSGRCFPLRHALAGKGFTDLIGYSTQLYEVYPAAALMSWGINISGTTAEPSYKTKGVPGLKARAELVDTLQATAVDAAGACWLKICPADLKMLHDHDDAIDALVGALVARVAALKGHPTDPAKVFSGADLDLIKAEGWIHLPPNMSLRNLPAQASSVCSVPVGGAGSE